MCFLGNLFSKLLFSAWEEQLWGPWLQADSSLPRAGWWADGLLAEKPCGRYPCFHHFHGPPRSSYTFVSKMQLMSLVCKEDWWLTDPNHTVFQSRESNPPNKNCWRAWQVHLQVICWDAHCQCLINCPHKPWIPCMLCSGIMVLNTSHFNSWKDVNNEMAFIIKVAGNTSLLFSAMNCHPGCCWAGGSGPD
jgi:hypothetical protein